MDFREQITLTGLDLVMRKTVQRCIMGSNRFVHDIPMLVEHTLAGRLDLDTMVSAEHRLDELPTTIADLDAGNVLGRAVVKL
jgi:Zn-dependent alcohol dehydrogenase